MRDKLTALGILLLLVTPTAMVAAQVRGATPALPLDLGYGPSSLTSISSGIPVYSVGDFVWMRSRYNQSVTVSLIPPNSVSPARTRTLDPATLLSLRSFTSSDPEGIWTLRVSTGLRTGFSIPIHFNKAEDRNVRLSVTQYSLQDNELSVGFAVNTTDSYDQEACLVGNQTRVTFPLPATTGTGEVGIEKRENDLIVTSSGDFNSSFTFWFELYYPYSYNLVNTSEYVSRNVRIAGSVPILISAPGTNSTSLVVDNPPRGGRVEIRAFFKDGSGLSVSGDRILVTGQDTWIQLSSCNLQRVNPASFSYLTSLDESPDTWPRMLYFMYRTNGVDSSYSLPLGLNVSKLLFTSLPWRTPVEDLRIQVEANQALRQASAFNGSLYLLARNYPLDIRYTLSFGKQVLETGAAEIARPYTVGEISVAVGKLNVQILNQEQSPSGATVHVSNGNYGLVASRTNVSSSATFFIPSGTYTVTALQGGLARSVNATITNGSETVVSVDMSSSLTFFEVSLMVVGVVGVAANVFAWLVKARTPTTSMK